MYTPIQIIKFNVGGYDGMSCFPADWSLDRIARHLSSSEDDYYYASVNVVVV